MDIDYKVVRRYLANEEKKGDREQIISWFSDYRFEKDIHKKYRQFWDELNEKEDVQDCDGSAIMGKIYHKIKSDEYKMPVRKKGLSRILNVLSKVAAVLFIPLVVYLWSSGGFDSRIDSQTAYSEIYSPLGTRTMFYLPDGSTGWLNGGSYLEFPTKFDGKSREVILKGEAYFDVVTNSRKPFVVKGEHADVTAYGTSFNVEAYSEDPDTRITLISGKVSVSAIIDGNKSKPIDVKPEQMYIFYPDKKLYKIDNVDVSEVTAWKEGQLAFRDESFNNVVRKINRWYNVKLMIMDESLKSYTYQATFMDETLDEVLKLLKYSAPITYRDLGREKKSDGSFEKRKIEVYYKPDKN